MSTKRFKTKNNTALYLIAIAVIVVAFLLLGGGTWTRGMMHGNWSTGMAHWCGFRLLLAWALASCLVFYSPGGNSDNYRVLK